MKKFLFGFLVFILAVVLLSSGNVLAQEPQEGGDLRIAIGADPESLDPVLASSSPAAMVMVHMMETLFEMTPEGDIVPLLAEDYSVSEDGLTYELYLREDVNFHDGEPFNAEAVKFNLERLIEDEAVFSFLINRITEIEVIDEYTISLTTDEPFAPILAHLSHDFISIISPAAVEEYGDQVGSNPVGTGKFKFDGWSRGESVIMSRNDDYWGEPAHLDTVRILVVPEESTRVVMLETGEAHAIMNVPPRDVDRLTENSDITVENVPSLRTLYVGLHAQKEPFDDIRVRKAVNYAVNTESIVNNILDGAGRPSDAPISPDIFGYSEQEIYERDPERARELLAEAGYPDGLELEFYYPVGRYPMDNIIAQAVQSQLAEVGIEANMTTMEWATYLEVINAEPDESPHDMYLLGWGTVTGDADYGLYALLHSGEWAPDGSNRSFYGNPEVDELLEAARIETDTEERKALYADAIEIIWDDAPWIFLHSISQINAVRSNVEGLVHHPRESILAHEAYLTD
ncbi:MAG: glutathione ABC transporter substrate-binding protein [Halarsenatibacteraceae bacterium]